MEFTEEQIEYVHELACRYHFHMSDGWRCDFCEPHCDCDEIYTYGLLEDYANKFCTTENLDKVREKITEY